MPTYAYVCTACDHSFEAVQAITDDALTECPSCGGDAAQEVPPGGRDVQGLWLLPHRQPQLVVQRWRRRRLEGVRRGGQGVR